MKSNKVSFIFISRNEGKQKTVNMHYRFFIILKAFFIICLLLLVTSYIILVPRAKKYTAYKEKIEEYQAQETQLKQLLHDVNEMSQFNTYMRELIGLDLPGNQNYDALMTAAAGRKDDLHLSTTPELAPVSGVITKKFMSGPRRHYGIDIAGKIGDPIRAAAAGLVVFSGWTPELGNMVVISHSHDYITVYGHNDRLNVQERQRVKKGDLIALLGDTGYSMGPHLHFEIWHKGQALDPQNVIPEYKTKN
ncbi:MAG: M23 family metallopeptidase [Candidatus Marinimicrobia bacterium]|nr:M23 family metallopeptidase [Candidatus Neomarinimicrobiota bacterium]